MTFFIKTVPHKRTSYRSAFKHNIAIGILYFDRTRLGERCNRKGTVIVIFCHGRIYFYSRKIGSSRSMSRTIPEQTFLRAYIYITISIHTYRAEYIGGQDRIGCTEIFKLLCTVGAEME